MRLALLLAACLLASTLAAQFGITTAMNFPTTQDQTTDFNTLESEKFFPSPEVALNYWFRLPNQRIEFLPTAYWTRNRVDPEFGNPSFNEYGAQMKVNVYPFDFLGDCGCPTFGKQGSQLQKGFYVQLAGGYAWYDAISPGDPGPQSGLTYGGGIGLDIGLSNFLTLTPQFNVRRATQPYLTLSAVDGGGNTLDDDAYRLLTYQAGLQLTFRLDHDRY